MKNSKKNDFFIKFIFYLFIGIYGVIIDISVSNFFFNLPILPEALRNDVLGLLPYNVVATIAALAGGIAGLINNFLMNEFLVYGKEGNKKEIVQRFYKYFIAILLGSFFIGKFLILNIGISVFHLGFTTSNVLAIAVGTIINYPINYFWTWGEFSVKDKVKSIHSKFSKNS